MVTACKQGYRYPSWRPGNHPQTGRASFSAPNGRLRGSTPILQDPTSLPGDRPVTALPSPTRGTVCLSYPRDEGVSPPTMPCVVPSESSRHGEPTFSLLEADPDCVVTRTPHRAVAELSIPPLHFPLQ